MGGSLASFANKVCVDLLKLPKHAKQLGETLYSAGPQMQCVWLRRARVVHAKTVFRGVCRAVVGLVMV